MEVPTYYEENAVGEIKQGRSTKLVGIIAVIAFVVIAAVVLGLIPVYIGAGNGSSDTTTTTTTTTTASTTTTTVTTAAQVTQAAITAAGDTEVTASSTLAVVSTPASSSRLYARQQTTDTCTSTTIVNLLTAIRAACESRMRLQSISSCLYNVTVTTDCTANSTSVVTTYVVETILSSRQYYCSISDLSTAYENSATDVETDVLAISPRSTVSKFDKTRTPMRVKGTASRVNNGQRITDNFDSCDYLNSLPSNPTCYVETNTTINSTTTAANQTTTVEGQTDAPTTTVEGQTGAPTTTFEGQTNAPTTTVEGQTDAPTTTVEGQTGAPTTTSADETTTEEDCEEL